MIPKILEILHSRFPDAQIEYRVLEPDFNPTWSFWTNGKEIPETRVNRDQMSMWRSSYTTEEIQDTVIEMVSGAFKRMA